MVERREAWGDYLKTLMSACIISWLWIVFGDSSWFNGREQRCLNHKQAAWPRPQKFVSVILSHSLPLPPNSIWALVVLSEKWNSLFPDPRVIQWLFEWHSVCFSLLFHCGLSLIPKHSQIILRYSSWVIKMIILLRLTLLKLNCGLIIPFYVSWSITNQIVFLPFSHSFVYVCVGMSVICNN